MKIIDLYSTETCHFCHLEKEFLNSQGIAFNDHVIAPDDIKTKTYLRDLTGQLGVPVTVITDSDKPDQEPQVLVGFSEALFRQVLGLGNATAAA